MQGQLEPSILSTEQPLTSSHRGHTCSSLLPKSGQLCQIQIMILVSIYFHFFLCTSYKKEKFRIFLIFDLNCVAISFLRTWSLYISAFPLAMNDLNFSKILPLYIRHHERATLQYLPLWEKWSQCRFSKKKEEDSEGNLYHVSIHPKM